MQNLDFSEKQIYKPTVREIAITLELHQKYCSDGENKHRLKELKTWLQRAKTHQNYYEGTIFAEFFNNMKDILSCVE